MRVLFGPHREAEAYAQFAIVEGRIDDVARALLAEGKLPVAEADQVRRRIDAEPDAEMAEQRRLVAEGQVPHLRVEPVTADHDVELAWRAPPEGDGDPAGPVVQRLDRIAIDILDAGIDVISAINIQHIESINEDVKAITGVEVTERVPDKLLQMADEVVNIDLTANELKTRLKEGKIYDHSKVQQALTNFFQPEKILQLRELALKEVAGQVERKVDYEVTAKDRPWRHEHFLACISSNHEMAQAIIRKTARLASYYNSKWFVLYVQTPRESLDKIPLAAQRHLINNFKSATEMGAEVLQVKDSNIAKVIMEIVEDKKITTVCIGKPHLNLFQVILRTNVFNQLLKTLSKNDVDLIILS